MSTIRRSTVGSSNMRGEMSSPPKRFSVVHSRTKDTCRAKSRSTDIRRYIVRRANLSRGIEVVDGLEFDLRNI